MLQPIALNRDTRVRLKRMPELLEQLRDEIQGTTHQPPIELSRVERVRPRTVITIVAVIVAAYLLIGQLGSVDLATVFAAARWRWVPLVALASAATYVGAALALTGYVRERLSFPRTVLAQLAASFAAFVTPPAVGGLAVNIRYLRKANLSPAAATTSVAVCQVVNSFSYFVLLIVFAAATGASAQHNVPIPSWAFIVIGGLIVVLLLALTVPVLRRWLLAKLLPPLREALPRLLDLVTSPLKLAEALLGALLLNAAYISALWCAVRAFDYDPTYVSVAVVYLAGAAIGSAAPTPGGLGAVEVALSTGLAAIGMPSAAAISAVLLYRVATFWLPVPLGWAAAQYLQSRDARSRRRPLAAGTAPRPCMLAGRQVLEARADGVRSRDRRSAARRADPRGPAHRPAGRGGGLTGTQQSVLATIASSGPIGLGELADAEGINPTMLSRDRGKLEDSRADPAPRSTRPTAARARRDHRGRHPAAPPGARRPVRPARRALANLPDESVAAVLAMIPSLEILAAEPGAEGERARVTGIKALGQQTFSSLENRNYRRYLSGQSTSLIGTWMQTIAQSWLVLELTHSATMVGLAVAVQTLPILILGPYAGRHRRPVRQAKADGRAAVADGRAGARPRTADGDARRAHVGGLRARAGARRQQRVREPGPAGVRPRDRRARTRPQRGQPQLRHGQRRPRDRARRSPASSSPPVASASASCSTRRASSPSSSRCFASTAPRCCPPTRPPAGAARCAPASAT